MTAAVERLDFAPPPERVGRKPLAFALLAHLLLAAALTWGIHWNRDDTRVAEAELWSQVPEQAAPPEQAPPPPPPEPEVKKAPPPPPPAPSREAQIALEKAKAQAELQKKQALEREKQRKLDAEKKEREKAEAQRKAEAAKKAEADKKRQQQAKAEESVKAKKDAEARDAKQREAVRQDALRRMQGLAGATGAESSTGTAAKASGPSDSYAGRVRTRVKPNIVFTDPIEGNPSAEVEVRLAPDGTITAQKITKPSGNKAWDDAVIRALQRTEVLPRDVDGRIHTPLILSFRPKD